MSPILAVLDMTRDSSDGLLDCRRFFAVGLAFPSSKKEQSLRETSEEFVAVTSCVEARSPQEISAGKTDDSDDSSFAIEFASSEEEISLEK